MKNTILFKLFPILIACFSFVTISQAQSESESKPQNNAEEQKGEKSILIKIEVDDEGNITSTDTIITYSHNKTKHVNEVIVEVEGESSDNQENIKTIKVEIESDEDGKEVFCINLSEKKEELEQVFKDLQKEIEDLEIDKEARKRIEQSMEKLQEVDWSSHYLSIKDALVDAHHEAFGAGEYEVVKVIIEDGDTTEYHTTVSSKSHNHDANVFVVKDGDDENTETVTVWVTDDGEMHMHGDSEEQVIVVNSNKDKNHKTVKVIVLSEDDDEDGHHHDSDDHAEEHHKHRMVKFETASKSDIEKANAAGIAISDDNKLVLRNLNIEINNEQVKIGVMTSEEGKLKVLALDDNFKTVKDIKSKKSGNEHQFSFDLNELESAHDEVKYLLIKQSGKLNLITL